MRSFQDKEDKMFREQFVGKADVAQFKNVSYIQGKPEEIYDYLHARDARLIAEIGERIGESHNLPPDISVMPCGLTDHRIVWDGNYYTCSNCGKEFVMKDDLLKSLDPHNPQ